MDIVRWILLIAHLLGFAALFGGLLVQVKEPVKKVNGMMRDGAGTAVVAGILLVGVLEMGDYPTPDHAKVAVKAVIGIVILALVMMNLRKEQISQAIYGTIFSLTIVNVIVAVTWASAHA